MLKVPKQKKVRCGCIMWQADKLSISACGHANQERDSAGGAAKAFKEVGSLGPSDPELPSGGHASLKTATETVTIG